MNAGQLENEIAALKAQLREAVRLLQLSTIQHDYCHDNPDWHASKDAFLAQHADIVNEING